MGSGATEAHNQAMQHQMYNEQYRLQTIHDAQIRQKGRFEAAQVDNMKQYNEFAPISTAYQEYVPHDTFQTTQPTFVPYPDQYPQSQYEPLREVSLEPVNDVTNGHLSQVPIHDSSSNGRYVGYSSGQHILSELLSMTGLPQCCPWPLVECNSFLKEMDSMIPVPSLTIPSRKSSSVILEIYDEVVSPLYPVFLRQELQTMLGEVYLNNLIARRDIAETTSNCYALILGQVVGILSRTQLGLSEMSVQCVKFTRSGLAELYLRPSLGGLRYLLSILLVNHAKELPDPIWFTSGSAVSMCVDLDLHREAAPTGQKISAEQHKVVEEKRRLFWSTYAIDRGLALALGRPMLLDEDAITRPFPTTVSARALARFQIRRLQSRILSSHQTLATSLGTMIAFPTEQERHFMRELADWRQARQGEELIQAGNTELLLLRRGLTNKDPSSMLRSLQVIAQNLELYRQEALQIAILEGLLVVHDISLNLITLLYIYKFGVGIHGPSLGHVQSFIADMKPIYQQLARRWSSALSNLCLIESIFKRLCFP